MELDFGCYKPGGRSMSPSAASELKKKNPDAICEVKSSSGKTLYYKRPGVAQHEEYRGKLEKAEKRLKEVEGKRTGLNPGSYKEKLNQKSLEIARKRVQIIKERLQDNKPALSLVYELLGKVSDNTGRKPGEPVRNERQRLYKKDQIVDAINKRLNGAKGNSADEKISDVASSIRDQAKRNGIDQNLVESAIAEWKSSYLKGSLLQEKAFSQVPKESNLPSNTTKKQYKGQPIPESMVALHDEIKYVPSDAKLTDFNAKIYGKRKHTNYMAVITGRDAKYGFGRQFLDKEHGLQKIWGKNDIEMKGKLIVPVGTFIEESENGKRTIYQVTENEYKKIGDPRETDVKNEIYKAFGAGSDSEMQPREGKKLYGNSRSPMRSGGQEVDETEGGYQSYRD